MTITVGATYENGTLRPTQPLALAEGAEVRLTIETAGDDYDPLDEVVGICTDGSDLSLAERHDEIIYGGLFRRERPKS